MKELDCLGQRALETSKENPLYTCFSYNISYPLSSVEELLRRFVNFKFSISPSLLTRCVFVLFLSSLFLYSLSHLCQLCGSSDNLHLFTKDFVDQRPRFVESLSSHNKRRQLLSLCFTITQSKNNCNINSRGFVIIRDIRLTQKHSQKSHSDILQTTSILSFTIPQI